MDALINKPVEVHVEKQLNALSVKFLGFVTFEDFVKIVEYECELIRQNNLNKCVVDLRQIRVYDKGMPEYVKDVWFPTVYSLGIRHVAFVVPEAPLAQRSMSRAHKDTELTSGIDVENFEDNKDALDWLKTC
jgi:hypothetical protein